MSTDEERSETKDWCVHAVGPWTEHVAYKGNPVEMVEVVALLNKLGATLPKRRRARKGSR